MTEIFAQTAPAYFARGLSVIPLRKHEKIPLPHRWQIYHESPIPKPLQDEWLRQYPSGNIGLVLGEQSGVVMIDVDTDDESVIQVIESVIPVSPWKRVGKKGYAAAYKYNGTAGFRIKDKEGGMLVEHLSSRMQVVLPPSIHPDTGRPYVANCDLLEVYDELPELPQGIEAILRGALELDGRKLSISGWTKTTEHVAAGSRDVQMVRMAGLCARGVMRGEYPFARALDDMRAWYESRVEKVAGDDIDITKGLRKVAEFIRTDVYEKGLALPVGWNADITPEELKSYGLDFDVDEQQWAFQQLDEYLSEQLTIHGEGTMQRMAAIEKVLEKMSSKQNSKLSPVEEHMLLEKIRSAFDKGMSVGAMRKQMKGYASGDIEGTDHSQIAQAMINDLERESQFRFHNGEFWSWEGSHWATVKDQQIRMQISQNYGHMDAAKRASDHKGIMDIMTHIAKQGLVEIEVQGVNFANGVFTESGKLVDHKHEYGFTYTLPYRYLEEEAHKATLFDKFIESSWGKDEDFNEKKDALQEAICATMFGWAPRYQRVFCLFGVPRSGKSQLLEIIEGLVPDNSVSSVTFDRWADQPSLVALDGKLVNIVGEMSVSRKIQSDIFNKVVVGEPISMRQLYKTTYLTRLKCAHWVGSNHAPKTDDPSAGFNRRWLYFTFDHQVAKKDIIPNLGRTITATEREAIMAWAMQARERLLKNHDYTLPKSHKEFVETVAGVNDSIRYFILSSGKVQTLPKVNGEWPSGPISDVQLHGAYSNFCLVGGVAKPVSIRMFKLRMREISQTLGWDRSQGKSDITGEQVALYYGPILVENQTGRL